MHRHSRAAAPEHIPVTARDHAQALGNMPWHLRTRRNDLRLHDNYAFNAAVKQVAANKADEVLPVYCFDPRFFQKSMWGTPKTGPHRWGHHPFAALPCWQQWRTARAAGCQAAAWHGADALPSRREAAGCPALPAGPGSCWRACRTPKAACRPLAATYWWQWASRRTSSQVRDSPPQGCLSVFPGSVADRQAAIRCGWLSSRPQQQPWCAHHAGLLEGTAPGGAVYTQEEVTSEELAVDARVARAIKVRPLPAGWPPRCCRGLVAGCHGRRAWSNAAHLLPAATAGSAERPLTPRPPPPLPAGRGGQAGQAVGQHAVPRG